MTKTIKSFTSNARYFLTINDETGECEDCQCPDHQFRHHECKHQRDFNTEFAKALKFNEMRQQYDSRLNGQADTQRCYYEMSLGA